MYTCSEELILDFQSVSVGGKQQMGVQYIGNFPNQNLGLCPV